ncbi:MAG: hypothetical protein SRB2_03243 [Desulfobacteraceae bacterium Eth-SRB2]|nr:MAG: hypothetical protein SRB2_03243 [Desulfobacteraceae bacterium Eth-SRB2]
MAHNLLKMIGIDHLSDRICCEPALLANQRRVGMAGALS